MKAKERHHYSRGMTGIEFIILCYLSFVGFVGLTIFNDLSESKIIEVSNFSNSWIQTGLILLLILEIIFIMLTVKLKENNTLENKGWASLATLSIWGTIIIFRLILEVITYEIITLILVCVFIIVLILMGIGIFLFLNDWLASVIRGK